MEMSKSEIFCPRRFGYFIAQDFRNCTKRVGLLTILCGLSPLFLFVFTFLINSAIGNSDWRISNGIKDMVSALVSVLYFLYVPITCYGFLTDKKDGSTYQMIPASHLEKYISAVLNCVIVFPLAFSVLNICTDLILTSLFPLRYSDTLAEIINIFNKSEYLSSSLTSFFLPLMISSVALAGALIFKKNKISKTFLTSAVSFILLMWIVTSINFDAGISRDLISTVWYSFQCVCAIACLVYVYFRTKKIEL